MNEKPWKMITIDDCDDCPHFDNEYYTWDAVCTLLNRHVGSGKAYVRTPPDDCPLPNATPKMNKEYTQAVREFTDE